MAPEENLYNSLRAAELDAAELSEIVLWHFHNARDISPTEVIFGVGADTESYALKFVYKKQKQRITQILAGSLLTALRLVQPLDLKSPSRSRSRFARNTAPCTDSNPYTTLY